LAFKGNRCRGCDKKAEEIHHASYTRAVLHGHDLKPLVPLCADCHNHIEFRDTGEKRNSVEANARLRELLSGDASEEYFSQESGSQGRQGRGPKKGCLLASVADYIGTYIVLPRRSRYVVAAWVMAAHLTELWDRFPHLAITSPEKRCGKTRLLQL